MKKIFYSVLCLFISFYAFAFSFDEKFPADKKTETIVQFMLKECPLDNGSFDINKNCWNNFTYFFENNKEDWVIPFCKAFNAAELKDYRYSFGYADWKNPISLAIQQNNFDLAKEIISVSPELINRRDTGGQFSGAEPVRYAVQTDNIELVQLMLKNIPDINKVVCATDKEEWELCYGKSNILTYAKSDDMKKLLINAGCKTYIPFDGSMKESHVIDNNVNIRDVPNLTGKKIDKLNFGTEIIVLGHDCYSYCIDGYSGHWIYIQYGDNKKGYIWQKYIDNHVK